MPYTYTAPRTMPNETEAELLHMTVHGSGRFNATIRLTAGGANRVVEMEGTLSGPQRRAIRQAVWDAAAAIGLVPAGVDT